MPAWQYYDIGTDGLDQTLQGLSYDYIFGTNRYVSPLGLLTFGLVYGEWDFWQHTESIQTVSWSSADNINSVSWSNADNIQTITWTAVDP